MKICNTELIEVENLSRVITNESKPRVLFENLSLSVNQGESLAVTGPSGSGKSSLLEILSFMRKPDSGVVRFQGQSVDLDDSIHCDQLRSNTIGIIYQTALLIESQTVLENVVHGLRYTNIDHQIWDDLALYRLEQVGLIDLHDSLVVCLSGGERQRVCIARAIVKNPVLLVCDEPTSSLDKKSAESVIEVLQKLKNDDDTALVFSTHKSSISNVCDQIIDITSIKPSEIRANIALPAGY